MFKHRFVRFLVSGGMGTLLSYGIYLVLLQVLDFRLSYTVSYVFGIIFAYVMGRFFVFKATQGAASILLFPLVYAAQYVLGVCVVWGSVEYLCMPQWIAPLIAVAVTIPCTYFLSKYLFVGRF